MMCGAQTKLTIPIENALPQQGTMFKMGGWIVGWNKIHGNTS